jgi:hypothetical protein
LLLSIHSMIHQKRKRIKYMESVITRDGINYPVYSSVVVSSNAVLRFGKSLLKLSKLNNSERLYLDYLTEVMDHQNIVFHNTKLRIDFIRYMGSEQVCTYSEAYLKKVFKSLTETEFLLSSDKRAVYHINPIYFCKASVDRERLIKDLIEKKILAVN